MKSNIYFFFSMLCIALAAGVLFVSHGDVPFAYSQTQASSTENVADKEAELKKTLEAEAARRAKELDRINQEIATTQKQIESVAKEKRTIQQELQRINTSIKALELTAQSDTVSVEKLTFEIRSIVFDIQDIEASIGDKKDAITSLMQELQKRYDASSLLLLMLNNENLADRVTAAQSLLEINNKLHVDIASLRLLSDTLAGKHNELSTKKEKTEAHRVNLLNRKVIIQDQEREKKVILNETKNKESSYQEQLKELQKQQNAIADEIEKIEDELRSRFDIGRLPIKRPGVFAWPVALATQGGNGYVTQHFGEKSSLYRGKPHNGLDIGIPIGTPIYAAEDGEITAVDNNDRSGFQRYQYGKYIIIRHNNSLATLYAHLSKQVVTKGAQVKRGDLIGYSGNTGYATGPHLHFGLYFASSITLKSVPPAAGLVPIGVVVAPEDYL